MNRFPSLIPERLRSLRALRGYSQEYMAQCLGVSQRTYSRWENDAHALSFATLTEICQILKVSIESLTSSDPALALELKDLKAEVCTLKELIGQLLPPPRNPLKRPGASRGLIVKAQSQKLAYFCGLSPFFNHATY